MNKGLFTTLAAAAISLVGTSVSFAAAPVISGIPDIIIGDKEDNIGTDNNFFVFTNAFQFDSYVTDNDSTKSALLWSFDEGDDQTSPVVAGTQWFKVNEKNPVHVGATAMAGDTVIVGGTHAAPGANELRAVSAFARFRNIIFTPTDNTAGINPSTLGATVVNRHATGKVVRFYAADEVGNLGTDDVIVSTIDNTTSDSQTGAPTFTPIVSTNNLPGAGPMWAQSTVTSQASFGTDTPNTAIQSVIATGSNTYRLAFWISNPGQTILYSQIGTSKYVRCKYYVYGTTTDSNLNNQPGFRLRVANRFAVNAMLEAFPNGSPAGAGAPDSEGLTLGQDFKPTNDPARPSIYRVDFDPIDVPRLITNAANENILLGFEAFAIGNVENGTISLTEVSLGTYDALGVAPANLVQTYTAADLDPTGRNASTGVQATGNFIQKPLSGNTLPSQNADSAIQITGSGSTGITLDTRTEPTDRIGLAVADYFGTLQSATAKLLRFRVAEGEQYKVRFHAVSTVNAIDNAWVRFRTKTVKFQWNTKLEIGPGRVAGATGNSALIAKEAIPGVGCLNPDVMGTETAGNDGGWYNLLMSTPMSKSIRKEASFAGQPLSVSMPNLSAQDPTGVDTGSGNAKSRRDINIGIDLIDSTEDETANLSNGLLTVDRVEIYRYPLVSDGDL